MKTAIRPHTGPDTNEPRDLADIVSHEVEGYRAWRTPEGNFLAEQLSRVVQLIAWTRATTPAEYADRLEVWEQATRDDTWESGRQAGLAEASERRTHGPLGRPLDPSCPYRSTGLADDAAPR